MKPPRLNLGLDRTAGEPGDPDTNGEHYLLIGRTRSAGELAYLRRWTPA